MSDLLRDYTYFRIKRSSLNRLLSGTWFRPSGRLTNFKITMWVSKCVMDTKESTMFPS